MNRKLLAGLVGAQLFSPVSCKPASRASSTHKPLDVSISTRPRTVAAQPCSADTSDGVEISGRCIGPIPIDSSLGTIARMVSAYPDSAKIENTPIAMWTFEVAGVTARATQFGKTIDPSQPADNWVVSGSGLLLPRGVRLPTTWSRLRLAFPGAANLSIGELGARASICALPRLQFQLLFRYGAEDQDTMTAESIPPDAMLGAVEVWPKDTTRC